ncbi:MAG: hypothetical protein HFJ30_00790 [Clostridia bacterium]|jgi:hypothetical protein|nr:hypothetical protein [Clostridia bacterium]
MKNEKDKANNIIYFKEELENKDYNYILELALEDNNREIFCNRLEEYQDDLLKIEKYAKCNQKISKLSEKIEEIENTEIRELLKEYEHQLNTQNEYDICLASALALRDGLIIGMIK